MGLSINQQSYGKDVSVRFGRNLWGSSFGRKEPNNSVLHFARNSGCLGFIEDAERNNLVDAIRRNV